MEAETIVAASKKISAGLKSYSIPIPKDATIAAIMVSRGELAFLSKSSSLANVSVSVSDGRKTRFLCGFGMRGGGVSDSEMRISSFSEIVVDIPKGAVDIILSLDAKDVFTAEVKIIWQ